MAQLSRKLRSVSFDLNATKTGIAFWCPGCKSAHAIITKITPGATPGPCWNWDGNINAPTISPSIRVIANFPPEDGGPHICHSFVEQGKIRFLGDCTHDLKGSTVGLPDWPDAGYEAGLYTDPPHDKAVYR